MLTVIPFFHGDKPLAIHLAKYLHFLGGVKHHDCLIVVEEGTSEQGVIEPLRDAFGSVQMITAQKVEIQAGRKWGDGTTDASGPNEMFLTAAHYIAHKIKRRWFWWEVDAALVRPTGLDEIEEEDKRGGKPFTGAYVDIQPHEPHMSGIAVYPPDISKYSLSMMLPGTIAWDYAARQDTVGKGLAHFTTLIQHVYRLPDGTAMTFPDLDSLKQVNPEAAIFHRCKNESLIDRLRERAALGKPKAEVKLTREQELEARVAELERLLKQKGGDEVCATPRINPTNQSNAQATITNNGSGVASNTAPTSNPKARGVKMKKKRVLSPEHKAKMIAGRKAAHARKVMTGVV